ncbi:Kynurenine formamidase [Fusarium sp. LHS14.1]|nr:Kynurenine formamidase [Fusarium sp. LHS14.1]
MSTTMETTTEDVKWQLAEVASPHIPNPVSVYVARNVPYASNPNRLQNVTIYAPHSLEPSINIGEVITSIPSVASPSKSPQWLVHIHGGAWRDPFLDSSSIEAAVAHAFSSDDSDVPISAIVSINYTLSPFPTHPTLPYDPKKGDQMDASRSAKHPGHIKDVLQAFTLLRSLGLKDDSYLLSGHSAGACLAFQAALFDAQYWGPELEVIPSPPRPAAVLGLNGLYDIPDLVSGLGDSHKHLQEVYEILLVQAFGEDQTAWPAASPGRFDVKTLTERVKEGSVARLVLLDQSPEDQLVPISQADKMERHLKEVQGIKLVRGHRCQGRHAAPWEEGYMIWQSVLDVLGMLDSEG